MSLDLLLIRHGESGMNYANKLLKDFDYMKQNNKKRFPKHCCEIARFLRKSLGEEKAIRIIHTFDQENIGINNDRRVIGGDGCLTVKGRLQARILGNYLENLIGNLDLIACSNALRSKLTYQNSEIYSKERFFSRNLQEQYKGDWEGMILGEINYEGMGWYVSPAKGESREDVAKRTLKSLIKQVCYKDVNFKSSDKYEAH